MNAADDDDRDDRDDRDDSDGARHSPSSDDAEPAVAAAAHVVVVGRDGELAIADVITPPRPERVGVFGRVPGWPRPLPIINVVDPGGRSGDRRSATSTAIWASLSHVFPRPRTAVRRGGVRCSTATCALCTFSCVGRTECSSTGGNHEVVSP